MIDSHCRNLWAKNSGEGMGRISTADYVSAPDDTAKQTLISQQRLRSKILVLWINNYLTTESKINLKAFGTSYNFNNQYYRAEMFLVIVKIVHPDTRAGCSDIKTQLEIMKMSQLNQDISKENLQIAEWMGYISVAGESYSDIFIQKFNLYSTSTCPLFDYYMYSRRSEQEE